MRAKTEVARFRTGALATLLSQVINVIGRIAVVPLFLRQWGEVGYGEWLALSAAVTYLSVLDLGVQNHVVNRLCLAWARGDRDEYRAVFRAALTGSLLLCGAVLSAALIVGPWLPVASWLDLKAWSPSTLNFAAVLVAAQVVIAIPVGIVIGVYRTVGEYARGMMVANVRTLLFVGGTIAALAWNGGPLEVAAAQLTPLGVVLALALWDIRRRHHDLPLSVGRFDATLGRSLVAPSLCFLLIQAAMLVSLQGSTLIVNAFFGAAAVTLFVTLRTLANLVRQISGCLGNTLWPQATELFARQQFETLREVHRLSAKLMVALTGSAAIALLLVGDDVVALWTMGAIRVDRALLASLLVFLLGQSVWMTSSVLLMAWGKQREVAFVQVVSCLGGLVAGAMLALSFGLAGLAVGMLAVDVLTCGWVLPRKACQSLGDSWSGFVGSVVGRGGLVVVAVFLAAWGVDSVTHLSPWPRIIVVSVVVGLSMATLSYRFWLDAGERTRARRLVGLPETPIDRMVPTAGRT